MHHVKIRVIEKVKYRKQASIKYDAQKCKNVLWYNPVYFIAVFGTHEKPHGVQGLRNNYHMRLYMKLGHGT